MKELIIKDTKIALANKLLRAIHLINLKVCLLFKV